MLFCPTLNQISNVNHVIKSYVYKTRLCQKLQEGMILEVFNAEQAKMAETVGVAAIIVSEPILLGFASMTDPFLIKEIRQVVSISIVGRACIEHYIEAEILETIRVNFIDESEVLGIADN